VITSRIGLATLGHLVKALLPADVARSISTRGQATFSVEYADTLLLLLRVTDDGELLSGLSAPSGKAFLPTRRLQYETEALDKATVASLLAAAQRRAVDRAQAIRDELGQGLHFVVPLRKREGAEQLWQDRITVGRATNKDIVLRDASVSKSHAWFELHEDREFSLTDAGSTNLTAVNGEALAPKKSRAIVEGDRVEFGSVVGFVCSAGTLWSAIHVSV
jgi:hypothetical protein